MLCFLHQTCHLIPCGPITYQGLRQVFWSCASKSTTVRSDYLNARSVDVPCLPCFEHGMSVQVATAAFKTLMALLGDAHQDEALLGCRSSLPTGQATLSNSAIHFGIHFGMHAQLCSTICTFPTSLFPSPCKQKCVLLFVHPATQGSRHTSFLQCAAVPTL